MKTFPLFVAVVLSSQIVARPLRAADSRGEERAVFDDAVESYSNGRYRKAADGFRKAYRMKPAWKLLYNLGQAEAAGKRYGLALDAFERYLVDGGDEVSRERYKEVREEIERLRGMVGYLRITAPEGAQIHINDVLRGTAPLNTELAVTPSVALNITATVNDEVVAERETKVIGGRTLDIKLTPETAAAEINGPPTTPLFDANAAPETEDDAPMVPTQEPVRKRSALKTWGWISIGLGSALLVGGGITGGLALAKNKSLREDCGSDGCYSSEYDRMDTRDALATSSTVLLAEGGVLAATGLVLLVIDHKNETKPHPVSLVPSPGSLVIEGRF